MLTTEENELLTQIGPGTPAGELLRRYWHPIAVAQELNEEHPTRLVRVLGEDLVLFRDKRGRVGLLAEHCAHRGASLLYGRVEERGLACAYHGWLYDTEGKIIATPAERNSGIMDSVRQKAYPVKKHIGLYWAYMGPLPAPVIPKYDVWARSDGYRRIHVEPHLDCNWLQAMENSVDPAHSPVLHQELIRTRGKARDTTVGLTELVEDFEFYLVPYGIMKRRVWKEGTGAGAGDDHPLIFPTVLRQGDGTQIRVPVDDTHTMIFRVQFIPSDDRELTENPEPEIIYNSAYKDPPDGIHPNTRFKLPPESRVFAAQDHMAWETQGAISNRTAEHLGGSDRGIILYRHMLKDNMEKVRQGLDPLAVVRDPDHEIIDTNLAEGLRLVRRTP